MSRTPRRKNRIRWVRQEGKDAALAGKSALANPYSVIDPDHDRWLNGFLSIWSAEAAQVAENSQIKEASENVESSTIEETEV